jgi:valyl-tRNA synthetase
MASLEQSIRKLIHKYNKHPQNSTKLEKDCVQCARHANHILKTLVAKRTSLGYAVQAFGEACDNYIEVFKKKCGKNEGERRMLMLVLTKWFTHFLRLRGELVQLLQQMKRHAYNC